MRKSKIQHKEETKTHKHCSILPVTPYYNCTTKVPSLTFSQLETTVLKL